MKKIILIFSLFIQFVGKAQIDSSEVKIGIGIQFSSNLVNNETILEFDASRTYSFFDIYKSEFPWPIPPGLEISLKKNRMIHIVGFKFKSFKNHTPKEDQSGLYDFLNGSAYYSFLYYPFSKFKHFYSGAKLLYERKAFKYQWILSQDFNKYNKSNLLSLQVPIGFTFDVRRRVCISIESSLNLSAYSNGKTQINNIIISPPQTIPIPVVLNNSFSKFYFPPQIVKQRYLFHATLIRIIYFLNSK
jgi:hypothetical protein